MPYFPDLTPYTFLPETVPNDLTALNVGWLDATHSFEKGISTGSLIEGLSYLCVNEARAATRGYHACELCAGSDPYPVTEVGWHGKTRRLGSAEVRVIDEDGTWLIAPNLIYHYVVEHDYAPPDRFVRSVIAKRVAPAD